MSKTERKALIKLVGICQFKRFQYRAQHPDYVEKFPNRGLALASLAHASN
jgi:hypothetical protein